MLLEEGLQSYLSGVAGVAALVGARIYPVALPQEGPYPAVTYERTGGEVIHAMGQDPGLSSAAMQLTCWGATYSSAKASAAAVRAALQNQLNVTWGGESGVVVQAAFVEGEKDDGYEPEARLYAVSVACLVWYKEA